jgi:hypothetical protein
MTEAIAQIHPQARGRGRPRVESDATPDFYEGALYKLLSERLSHHMVRSNLNVTSLSREIGFSRQAIYRWLTTDRLAIKAARALIAASRGKISQEDITPFLF